MKDDWSGRRDVRGIGGQLCFKQGTGERERGFPIVRGNCQMPARHEQTDQQAEHQQQDDEGQRAERGPQQGPQRHAAKVISLRKRAMKRRICGLGHGCALAVYGLSPDAVGAETTNAGDSSATMFVADFLQPAIPQPGNHPPQSSIPGRGATESHPPTRRVHDQIKPSPDPRTK